MKNRLTGRGAPEQTFVAKTHSSTAGAESVKLADRGQSGARVFDDTASEGLHFVAIRFDQIGMLPDSDAKRLAAGVKKNTAVVLPGQGNQSGVKILRNARGQATGKNNDGFGFPAGKLLVASASKFAEFAQ